MPVDYYPQLSEEQLLVMLTSLQNRGTTGEVVFTTFAGVQTQKTFEGGERVGLSMRRVLYSLHLRNSAAYENPYTQRVRVTLPTYTNQRTE